jgi:hypothetical protein
MINGRCFNIEEVGKKVAGMSIKEFKDFLRFKISGAKFILWSIVTIFKDLQIF